MRPGLRKERGVNDLTSFSLITLGLLAAISLLLYVLTVIDPQTETAAAQAARAR